LLLDSGELSEDKHGAIITVTGSEGREKRGEEGEVNDVFS